MRPAAAAGSCPHCGLAVEGAEDVFCCAGCALAAQIVAGAGLQRWYEQRQLPAPRPGVARGDWAAVPVEEVSAGSQCRLAIDGLRCASCVWLVEGVLERTPGVVHARVSYATGRSVITFDPELVGVGDLGERIAALGYRPRPVGAEATTDRDLLTRLGLAAFCTANVMLLAASVYVGWFDGMAERYTALFRWTQLALATPVALWSAAPFFAAAWASLQNRILHLDLPISLAVGTMYAHALVATPLGHDGFLDSLCMLVTLLLAGRVVEARGRRAAAAAAASLAASLPTTARRLTADGVQTVRVEELAPGDRIEAGLGDEIPADGVVERGAAEVRMALLTGESAPVSVVPGHRVVAGAPVVAGSVVVRVEVVGEETLGRRMVAQVASAVDRGLLPTPGDRLAPWFTGLTLAAAAVGAVGWSVAAGWGVGLQVAVAVLVVACPCALGLSGPVAVHAGLGALARRGAVLSSGQTLLQLALVDRIALDKTGTVTAGTPRVVAADDAVLRIAAGLERASNHPLAAAIRDEAARRGLPMPLASEIREEPGAGISGTLDGQRWCLSSGGAGVVRLDGDAGLVGLIRVADTRRDDAATAVAALRRFAPVAVLTGDHADVADAIAAQVQPDEVRAGMSPEAKAGWVEERRSEGHRVLFVGDGLNDGPALVKADVGLAMRTGAPSTLLAADGVVVDEALGPVVAALRVARVVRRTVRANLVRSVGYNAVAVTLALAGWVDPLVAAVLMPLSSLLVLWGGMRIEGRVRAEEAWTSS